MNLRRRIERLEAARAGGQPPRSSCPKCRDVAPRVLTVYRRDGPGAPAVVQSGYEPPERCPDCGRVPVTVEVVEVLVSSREEAAAGVE